MIAVLAGGTGLVGSAVLDLLLSDPEITEIKLFTRRDLNKHHPKMKIIIGELSDLPKFEHELKGDAYLCCLGTTIKTAKTKENFRKVDYEAVVNFGKIAASHQAKSFVVVSANGAHKDSRIYYSRVKGEMEQSLSKLTLQNMTIFRPGLLIGHRKEKRLMEELAIQSMKPLEFLIPKKLHKSLATDVTALAHAMVAVAKSVKAGINIIEASQI